MLYTPTEEDSILLLSSLVERLPHETLAAVKANYNEPHRHYHAWHHALSVISWTNYCSEMTDLKDYGPYDFALAALFHDAVYDSAGSPSNEERSVQFFRHHRHGGMGSEMLAVEHLIMLTAKHGKLASRDVTPTEALFLDCDMASFGERRWELTLWNELNIQAEFLTRYTQEQVNVGRRVFLTGLLQKESIFLSKHFQELFEAQARHNITRLIARLNG